jgi:hypothetical protein
MKEFLNKVAKKNMHTNNNMKDFAIAFYKTTKYINNSLREKPFHIRGPFNLSLFDSVFCNILMNIDNLPDNLPSRFEKLLTDKKFVEYTTLATSDEKILKERFKYVKSFLIDNVI